MNDNKILVSIIVPIYGTEAYLPACIDSILRQTYQNIQIILVDDQSPDKCSQICDEYAKKDDRIRVIHQENKGVSGARNTGIRCATGEYIMFVDSDDELYSNSVEILLTDAQMYEADVVSGMRTWVDYNGKETFYNEDKEVFCYYGDQPLLLSLSGEMYTRSVWSKLFKASFIKGIYFEEGKKIHEDGFFIFQCYAKKPKVVHRNVLVYRYNIREGSASRQCFSDKYLSMLYFAEKKKNFICEEYPQYIEHAYNMEVRTNLQFLDVLCSSTDKAYRDLQKRCVEVVRNLRSYHRPINKHYRLLEKIVVFGGYGLYKIAVRLKHYR